MIYKEIRKIDKEYGIDMELRSESQFCFLRLFAETKVYLFCFSAALLGPVGASYE